VQSNTKVRGPIYFATEFGTVSLLCTHLYLGLIKISVTAAFPCPLVHSLPYCFSTSYSVHFPVPTTPFTTYESTILPTNITTPVLSYVTNITTTLNTFGRGRDLYSPIQTLSDCQSAYMKWRCSVSFTRRGEVLSTSPSAYASQSPLPALSPITGRYYTEY
jgi:calcium channel MID1